MGVVAARRPGVQRKQASQVGVVADENWLPNTLDDQIKQFGEIKSLFLDNLTETLFKNTDQF